jgi:hypothetical protein
VFTLCCGWVMRKRTRGLRRINHVQSYGSVNSVQYWSPRSTFHHSPKIFIYTLSMTTNAAIILNWAILCSVSCNIIMSFQSCWNFLLYHWVLNSVNGDYKIESHSK